MSNYPTSLDTFVNPTTADTLDSPPHATQHSDINDAVEALEAKVGIGASSAGSATTGQVLTAQGGGTAIWQDLPADTSGLVHIKQVSTGGAVSSVSVNDCFSANYNTYRIIFNLAASATGIDVNLRLRVSGTDESGSIYRRQALTANGTSVTAIRLTNETSWVGVQFTFDTTANSGDTNHLEIFNPFEAKPTSAETILAPGLTGNIQFIKQVFGINNTVSYTGFSIIPTSGTIDGTISVLGYRQ